jgi:tRNA-specific 2-thiouridylase
MYFSNFFSQRFFMIQGIVMFSGGLDSTVVVHLLKSQGIKVKALHFVLPFYSGLGLTHQKIREYADHLGVPLQIEEEGEEYIEMIRDPRFGFGKHANPCVDCRIRRLVHAKKIMQAEGASFIATGEVAGQRPMSQGYNSMNAIEKRAEVKGFLLRPLSAKLLPSTEAENSGLVDRDKLFNWSGRGRILQLEYAEKFNLKHATPAGGCILTTVDSSRRFHEFVDHTPDYSLLDFKLLAYGRHFRINPSCKLIVGRNDQENEIIIQLLSAVNNSLEMLDSLGPDGFIRGNYSEEDLLLCCALLARFSKEKNNENVRVALMENAKIVRTIIVAPADIAICDKYRI